MTIGWGHRVVDGDPYEPGVEYPKEVLEQQFEKIFLSIFMQQKDISVIVKFLIQ